jgi:hypothetical protein
MYVSQYKLLNGVWKVHFEFLSLKKTDHKDLSPFKLSYNERLFKLLIKDQKESYDRGKSKYEELARRIFDEAEKEIFVRNKEGISLFSLKGAILESEVITGIHLKEHGGNGYKYPILMVKCYLSTISLNQEEITFLSTALPCHLDNDGSGITIAVASIPIMKKSSLKQEERITRWAQKKSIEKVEDYYFKVFNKRPPKPSFLKRLDALKEDIIIKYFF